MIVIIIRSFVNYPRLEKLKEKTNNEDEDFYSLGMVASGPFTYEFVKAHLDKFNSLYEILQDDKNKQVLTAYLNQKITRRFKEMEGLSDKLQYYDGDFCSIEKIA